MAHKVLEQDPEGLEDCCGRREAEFDQLPEQLCVAQPRKQVVLLRPLARMQHGKVLLDNRKHAIIATMVFAISLVIILIVGATGPDVLIMHTGNGDRVFPITEGTDHASYYCRVINMRPENQLVWCARRARRARAAPPTASDSAFCFLFI